MANHHDIVARVIQPSPCLVSHGDIVQDVAGFEREFRNNRGGLIDQRRIARGRCRGDLERCFCDGDKSANLVEQ